ncbi:MAG: hypothetical protein PHY56_04610 [Candidatus Omnitrophica bacterium]|nr:hypothetical protein [Candidatus Omnitrophota bacterium]
MINLLYFNDILNLKKFSNLPWAYLGSHKGIEYIKGSLDENKRRFIAKEIECIIESSRGNFVDFIGKVSTYQRDKVIWYCSRMASKSISQNTMFQQYIYLKLLDKFIQDKVDILFITDDYELIDNAKNVFCGRINLLSQKLFRISVLIDKAKKPLKIIKYFCVWIVSTFLKNREAGKFDIIIHAWVNEKTFTKLPVFYDSNFDDLEDFLKQKGRKVGRITSLFLPVRHMLKLRKHFSNMVFPLSYLSFWGFLRSVFTRFKINEKAMAEENFSGIKDLKALIPLAKKEVFKENSSLYFLNYLLLFHSYKSMNNRIDKNVSFIYPFENQPWEKVFNLAMAGFNRVGYQHSSIPSNWLEYRGSQYETENSHLPKTILTTGIKSSDFLKMYFKGPIINEAGAIRFKYLFSEHIKNNGSRLKYNNLVVATPLDLNTTNSLLSQLLKILQQGGISEYSVKIKLHPHLRKEGFIKDKFKDFKNCSFVEDNLNKLLKECDLFITSCSAAVFDSLFSGVKTLYFIPEGVSFGVEYFIREHLFLAYESDFSEKLKEALDSTQQPRVNIREYFSYPNLDMFLPYLIRN